MERLPADNGKRPTRKRAWFRDLSIKRKLLLIMMAVSIAALTFASTAFVIIEVSSFRQTMVRHLSALAEVVGYNSSASLVFSDSTDAGAVLKTLQAKPDVRAAWLFDAQGTLLAGYLKDGDPAMPTPAPPERDLHMFNGDGLVVNHRIFLNEQDIGGIVIISGLEEMKSILRRNLLTMLAVTLGALLLIYFLSTRLLRLISGPISKLALVARGVSEDRNYGIRAEKYAKDEIGLLYDAFNSMLDTVQERESDLVAAKKEAEASAGKSRDLLAAMTRINSELEMEVAKRKQIEAELRQHRAELELTVDTRTAQLTEANLRLEKEVEEKRRAEENMRKALEEKLVLLGEIHHRVKNNLQIIASLLEMSKSRARTPEAAEQLGDAHGKIFTMALIHSQLYQDDRFNDVNMERHAKELFSHLSGLYSREKPIAAGINISGLRLPVTQAIPCALILNELISNVCKHAFDPQTRGTLFISMEHKKEGMVEMEVTDDGAGIPEEIDIDNTQSLGLKLVRNIARHQLRGTLHIDGRSGTRVRISFPSWKDSAYAQDSPG